MNKLLFTYFFILIFSTASGQTIQELEYDLSWYKSSEKYGDKIDKAKRLQELDPFNYDAIEYICRYYKDREIDSISIYFDNLISKFPNNTEPYLLRAELLFLEHDFRDRDCYNKLKIKYLSSALILNSSDQTTIYKIAEVYYKDFIYPLEKEKDWGYGSGMDSLIYQVMDSISIQELIRKRETIKQSTFEHPADSALMYFYKLWVLNNEDKEIIFYPIRQLECYLSKLEVSEIPINADSNFEQCFLPSSYFANLDINWQCDYKVDYLFVIESAKRKADWLKIQLADLKEECLFNKELQPNTTVYRFTWLRSFHNPISIRLEKYNESLMLYWKLGKGEGGYNPKGLKKSGKKKLNISNWETFQQLVIDSGFDSLPHETYVSMTDGATWTLERKNGTNFKAHNTNEPNKEFITACLFLLELTNIKVKKDDIY